MRRQEDHENVLKIEKQTYIIMYRIFIMFFLSIWANICWGQVDSRKIEKFNDSICNSLPKYEHPERRAIDFPAIAVSDKYKIKEVHRAMPTPPEDGYDGVYDYYFTSPLGDYDPISDSIFTVESDVFLYKLKDTYFFDINGDGKLDFIHYPLYYKAIWFDYDVYDIFVKTKKGYKRIPFNGFIVDINFDEKGVLNEMKTFQPECCASGFAMFFYYKFDAIKNELLNTKTEKIWNCQFNSDNINKHN
jgi:hypothetical protein